MMSWTYVAGFFDGEGTITKYGRRTRLAISQTSYPVLQGIRVFTGLGRIVKVRKRHKHWKDAWVFSVTAQEEVYRFLSRTLPYLIVKRKKATAALRSLQHLLTKYKAKKIKSAEIRRRIHQLRKKELTYRDIGKILKIDWGNARRIDIGER